MNPLLVTYRSLHEHAQLFSVRLLGAAGNMLHIAREGLPGSYLLQYVLDRSLQILPLHGLEQVALRPEAYRFLGIGEIAVAADDQVIYFNVLLLGMGH
ncbi:hypothetical protein D3C73_1168830 [compost metagenome]